MEHIIIVFMQLTKYLTICTYIVFKQLISCPKIKYHRKWCRSEYFITLKKLGKT